MMKTTMVEHNAFMPPTKDLEYNLMVLLRQGFSLNRQELVSAYGTARINETIWRLIEKGLIEWNEDYSCVRAKANTLRRLRYE